MEGTKIMESLESQVGEWLESKRATLFGQSFDLTQPLGFAAAKEWFVKQLNDFDEFLLEGQF